MQHGVFVVGSRRPARSASVKLVTGAAEQRTQHLHARARCIAQGAPGRWEQRGDGGRAKNLNFSALLVQGLGGCLCVRFAVQRYVSTTLVVNSAASFGV